MESLTSVYSSLQANHLETETISYEEKEQQLVNDCVKELREYWTPSSCALVTGDSSVVGITPPRSLWGREGAKMQLYWQVLRFAESSVLPPRWCQPADFLSGRRSGQEVWRRLQAAGGDHTPPLPDSRPPEEGQAGMKTPHISYIVDTRADAGSKPACLFGLSWHWVQLSFWNCKSKNLLLDSIHRGLKLCHRCCRELFTCLFTQNTTWRILDEFHHCYRALSPLNSKLINIERFGMWATLYFHGPLTTHMNTHAKCEARAHTDRDFWNY